MEDSINPSYKDRSKRALEKAYNINQNYFLHIDQGALFDLGRSFFITEVRKNGNYFKIIKEK